jgi:hypothetical protein
MQLEVGLYVFEILQDIATKLEDMWPYLRKYKPQLNCKW